MKVFKLLGIMILISITWTNIAKSAELNIYSHRQPFLINPFLEEFTKKTGITTNVIYSTKGLAGLGDLYVSSGGGRNAKMGSYIGEGLTFSKAKKTKMEKITVEGADLAIEIGKKVNEDFDNKKLPLMLGMINAIIEDKKLELDWESFR